MISERTAIGSTQQFVNTQRGLQHEAYPGGSAFRNVQISPPLQPYYHPPHFPQYHYPLPPGSHTQSSGVAPSVQATPQVSHHPAPSGLVQPSLGFLPPGSAPPPVPVVGLGLGSSVPPSNIPAQSLPLCAPQPPMHLEPTSAVPEAVSAQIARGMWLYSMEVYC